MTLQRWVGLSGWVLSAITIVGNLAYQGSPQIVLSVCVSLFCLIFFLVSIFVENKAIKIFQVCIILGISFLIMIANRHEPDINVKIAMAFSGLVLFQVSIFLVWSFDLLGKKPFPLLVFGVITVIVFMIILIGVYPTAIAVSALVVLSFVAIGYIVQDKITKYQNALKEAIERAERLENALEERLRYGENDGH